MEKQEIIRSITERTNGELYLGVVGAVRTGKSTFIKKVIESLVVPNIEDEYERKRCLDEIPQSAQGKTIMTTEPKTASLFLINLLKTCIVGDRTFTLETSSSFTSPFAFVSLFFFFFNTSLRL